MNNKKRRKDNLLIFNACFVLIPLIALFQWLNNDNLINAVGLLFMTLILWMFRPLVELAGEPQLMSSVVTPQQIEQLQRGEVVTLRFSRTEVILVPEKASNAVKRS